MHTEESDMRFVTRKMSSKGKMTAGEKKVQRMV